MKRIFLCLCIAFIACDDNNAGNQQEETKFVSSQYRIAASEMPGLLNMEASAIDGAESSDEAVATVALDNGDLVITSVAEGPLNISIYDAVTKSNSASLSVYVDKTGAISVNVMSKYPDPENLVKAIIKEPSEIIGTVGEAITPVTIKLMLDNDDFADIALNSDCSSWVLNLPPGLGAAVSYIQPGEHPHELSLTISGNPTAASTELLNIVIQVTARGYPVKVQVNEGACFKIS